MKMGVFGGPEPESGLRIGLRAVVFEMSEKSIYRKMRLGVYLREPIFLKMCRFLYIFQICLQNNCFMGFFGEKNPSTKSMRAAGKSRGLEKGVTFFRTDQITRGVFSSIFASG